MLILTDSFTFIDALEELEGKQVNLVVTDWNMPEMNGAELVKTLRGMLTCPLS